MGERATMGEQSLPSARALSEDRLDSWKEIAAYLDRDVTTVQRWEKREGMPVHRHLHDRMGSVYALRAELDAWARSRNVQQPAPGTETRPRRMPLLRCRNRRYRPPEPEGKSSCCWRRRQPHWRSASCLWLQGTEYFWRNPIADARLSDHHRLRWSGAGRGRVARWSVRRVSVGPGRADGRLGYAGRFGTVPQLDSRQRAGTRQSIGPHVGVSRPTALSSPIGFAGKSARAAATSASWAVPTLGGQPTPYLEGVAEFDWSRDGSRLATTRPDPETRCSCPTAAGHHGEPAHLHCACRTPLSLSLVVARHGLHLLRPGLPPRQIGHLAHPSNRRNSGTDHVAQCARKSSRPIGSAHADVPRQRSRWLGTMALWHGRRAPHSPPAHLWPRPVHVAGRQR